MQDFSDLYLEHGEMVLTNEEVLWVDLWADQVNFLEDEFHFPSPAVFLQYMMLNTEDIGEKVQKVTWQVDVRLFYETMASTDMDSMNRSTAVEFTKLLTKIHALFHGSNGVNYSSMRRIGLAPEGTGGAGNLYRLSFTCVSIDYSAQKEYLDSTLGELDVVKEAGPSSEPDNFFKLD